MHFVSDLHLHSRFSRAVSPQMNLPVMAQYARQKGIHILTASDFTHPVWFKEIKEQLEETGEGVYKLKEPFDSAQGKNDVRFLLSTEISSIYKQAGKLRRVHNLVFVPGFEAAEKLTQELVGRGCNLNADGRPIIGLSSKNLLELLLSIDDRSMLIPCHVWTPHFGIYGSASGFESLEEGFGDLAPYVYGIETGISSDPEMNWQIKELENRSILSFSDAHSPAKMAREATVFDLPEVGYENIREAIMWPSKIPTVAPHPSPLPPGARESFKTPSPFKGRTQGARLLDKGKEGRGEGRKVDVTPRIVYTIEFFPEEGKYHFSGHRNCKVVVGPDEIRAGSNVCPVCRRRLTEGVLFRVQQLVDESLCGRLDEKIDQQGVKWLTDKRGLQPSFVKLVPLLEIVAQALGSTTASQKSQKMFADLCEQLGSELDVLLEASMEAITRVSNERVAEAVQKVRVGDIAIDPGYDGEYGKVRIWDTPDGVSLRKSSGRKVESAGQMKLDI